MVVNNSQTEFSDGTRFDDSTVASAAAAASKGGVHTQVFSLRQPTLVGVAVCWLWWCRPSRRRGEITVLHNSRTLSELLPNWLMRMNVPRLLMYNYHHHHPEHCKKISERKWNLATEKRSEEKILKPYYITRSHKRHYTFVSGAWFHSEFHGVELKTRF